MHTGPIYEIKKLTSNKFITLSEDKQILFWNINGEILKRIKEQNSLRTIEIFNKMALLTGGSIDCSIKFYL
jgi:hypothetical protein